MIKLGLIEFFFVYRDQLNEKRFLWRAPELLRNPNPPNRGTQKGDVYSFGIVLFEIVGRIGPWGEINYSNEGSELMLKITKREFKKNQLV